jgi:hypothetical protein
VAASRDVATVCPRRSDVLKNKFDLLTGERKAFFETYEATKKSNEQLLR